MCALELEPQVKDASKRAEAIVREIELRNASIIGTMESASKRQELALIAAPTIEQYANVVQPYLRYSASSPQMHTLHRQQIGWRDYLKNILSTTHHIVL